MTNQCRRPRLHAPTDSGLHDPDRNQDRTLPRYLSRGRPNHRVVAGLTAYVAAHRRYGRHTPLLADRNCTGSAWLSRRPLLLTPESYYVCPRPFISPLLHL